MREEVKRPDLARVLAGLKDFQRNSVAYAIERMYDPVRPARRFLIADEVGLGKTLVARGIVAWVINELWDRVERIDVIYICSNTDIARQNISKLNVTGQEDAALPSRITLLPVKVKELAQRRLNFISFTPGTSFDLRSSLGTAEERALVYWLLPDDWKQDEIGARYLMQGSAGRASFKGRVRDFARDYEIDETLRHKYRVLLQKASATMSPSARGLRDRFVELCASLRGQDDVPDELKPERTAIVGELRSLLATACLNALEPDLIILDEFQRFKHLLHGEDEASRLARNLFTYGDARVLLLSATPYKMYTLSGEFEPEDHFKDFVQTVAFLQDDAARTEQFTLALAGYGRELYRMAGGSDELHAVTERVRDALREIMVRTERLAVTPNRDGMLAEVAPQAMKLDAADLDAYVAVQRVARARDQGDALDYWKSAPYLLNFMENYELKRGLREELERGNPALHEAIAAGAGSLLRWSDVEGYERIDPGNPRLRSLMSDVIDRGVWRLLWLPPSMPYYRLAGPFAAPELNGFTKRLIFSAWQVVPKVVATLVSYEAERRMFRLAEESAVNTPEERRRRRPLLRFTRSEGRLTGMPVLGLAYPSITLAALGDPLALEPAIAQGEQPPALEDVLSAVRARLEEASHALSAFEDQEQAEDEAWYWAAPILLDLMGYERATRDWLNQEGLVDLWRGHDGTKEADASEEEEEENQDDRREDEEGWAQHVKEAMTMLARGVRLGRRPNDLLDVLALMAIAAPGVVALRALSRVTGVHAILTDPVVRNRAGHIAWSLRALFNLPEVTALVRGLDPREPYWWRVLEYCANGCLQAVLDEYVHVLVDWRGVTGEKPGRIADEMAGTIGPVLRLRTANLGVDLLHVDPESRQVRMESKPRGFRARLALRYGERRGEEGASDKRRQAVWTAFNSPFWPFVLCSTSVGQEGLDFHLYCHAVVHWNLPPNPVDLEQREGRVHRYKGHAIRKNVALRHAHEAFQAGGGDPWARLFASALDERPAGTSDLVPFWVYAAEGGARIERHLPFLPLSREEDRAAALKRSLAVYRLAFGQSRQEDLVNYLMAHVPEADLVNVAGRLRIDLSPPKVANLTYDTAGAGSARPASAMVSEVPDSGRAQTERTARDVPGMWEHQIAEGGRREPAKRPRSVWAIDARRARELLDRFAGLRPRHATKLPVARLRELLDEFARREARSSPRG